MHNLHQRLQTWGKVYRLSCSHLFHEGFWDGYITSVQEIECPNWRGPGIAKAKYVHLGTRPRPGNPDDDITVPLPESRQSTPTASVFMTADQLADWSRSWSLLSPDEYAEQNRASQGSGTAGKRTSEAVYLNDHAKTKLPHGKTPL